MERKLMQSKAANIDLENNMDEFATTNRFLVKELEELKRSYSEFLSVSRESVRGVTKGGVVAIGVGSVVTHVLKI